MEYRDIDSNIDIEAHIRNAKRLRAEALDDILGNVLKKTVRGFKRLVNRRLRAHIVAARSSASAIY